MKASDFDKKFDDNQEDIIDDLDQALDKSSKGNLKAVS